MSVKNPILLDVPNIIKTKRLIMRPILPEDAEIMLNALNDTHKELQEFLTWADPIPTLENTRERNSQLLSRFILRESFSFNLFSKNGDFAGNCHILGLNWQIPSSIIGYWSNKKFHAQGLMTEAVKAISLFGFQHLKLKRMMIQCDVDNFASAKVAEKSGFELELTANDLIPAKEGELRTTHQYVRFNANDIDQSEIEFETVSFLNADHIFNKKSTKKLVDA
jgi:RimJ/RimL family protein N-acetyltransferase